MKNTYIFKTLIFFQAIACQYFAQAYLLEQNVMPKQRIFVPFPNYCSSTAVQAINLEQPLSTNAK